MEHVPTLFLNLTSLNQVDYVVFGIKNDGNSTSQKSTPFITGNTLEENSTQPTPSNLFQTPSVFNNTNFLDVPQTIAGNTTSHPPSTTHLYLIVLISVLFCIIGVVGIVGNSSVILMILLDRQMRRSVTNLYIMNLAAADLLIMLFGIPEIAQFMLNKGWLLGEVMCKLERFFLVVSLYTSVITQVAVCIER